MCSRLESSLQALAEETKGLSDLQWRFKPDPDSWSVAQCVEHLADVEVSVYGRVQSIMQEGFSDPALCQEALGKEVFLSRAVPKRGRKVQAPKQPGGAAGFSSLAGGLEAFAQLRGVTLWFAQTTDAELEKYVYPHFVFGQLNLQQWLLMLGLHCERHTAQIGEIKANPEFPTA